MELAAEIYSKVTALSKQGSRSMHAGDSAGAIRVWREALDLLPPPPQQWEAAMWLHASIGDAFREARDHVEALEAFRAAAASDGGDANPFVQIGLGATLYDLQRSEEATEPLLRAYMLEGKTIFDDFGGPYLDHLNAEKLLD